MAAAWARARRRVGRSRPAQAPAQTPGPRIPRRRAPGAAPVSSPPRASSSHADAVHDAGERALPGGPERHREKAVEQGKLPVRERVALLLDEGSFTEKALLANWQEDGLGA